MKNPIAKPHWIEANGSPDCLYDYVCVHAEEYQEDAIESLLERFELSPEDDTYQQKLEELRAGYWVTFNESEGGKVESCDCPTPWMHDESNSMDARCTRQGYLVMTLSDWISNNPEFFVQPDCNQCEPCMIQGVFTHELGCINSNNQGVEL